jgi:hypothetical protein
MCVRASEGPSAFHTALPPLSYGKERKDTHRICEPEGKTPENLHYDLPMTFKGGKKERQGGLCEDQDQPIRTLHTQPTKVLSTPH